MRKLTASKAPLFAACRYWLRDDGPELEYDEPGYPAKVGTTVGKMAELFLTFPGAESIERETENMKAPPYIQRRTLNMWAQLRKWLEVNAARTWESEIVYELHRDTLQGKRLGYGGASRDYPTTEHIYGTVDVVDPTTRLVLDFKCSHKAPWPRYWPQLGLLALAAFGVDAAAIQLVHITELGVTSKTMRLNPIKMMEVRGKVRVHLDNVPTAEAQPGDHCSGLYCPARFTCAYSTAKKKEKDKDK